MSFIKKALAKTGSMVTSAANQASDFYPAGGIHSFQVHGFI